MVPRQNSTLFPSFQARRRRSWWKLGAGGLGEARRRPVQSPDRLSRLKRLADLAGNGIRREGRIAQRARQHNATYYSMKHNSIKASTIIERKTKAKVVDWVPRKRSRGTRNIPIDVTPLGSTSRRTPRRATSRIEDNAATLHEATFPSTDVNDLWTEETEFPVKKRVSWPVCHSSAVADAFLRQASAPTWKSSLLG
jgi:hypothetical protein